MRSIWSAAAGIAEKVLATYVQALIALLLLRDDLSIDALEAASVAAVPAALSAFLALLPLVPPGLSFWHDVALRTLRTYVATFLGLLIALPVFDLDVTMLSAAATSAVPAALAVLKGALAGRVGSGSSAALLPASLTPPAGT